MMLKCWDGDSKSRLCFKEIVAKLSELLPIDDECVIDNVGVDDDDGYILDDPTRTTD